MLKKVEEALNSKLSVEVHSLFKTFNFLDLKNLKLEKSENGVWLNMQSDLINGKIFFSSKVVDNDVKIYRFINQDAEDKCNDFEFEFHDETSFMMELWECLKLLK